MTHPCPATHCDRPASGAATICGACTAELERALAQVPALARELDVTLSRQTSKTGGGKGSETPLPYDARASEAAWVLRSTLVGWVRVMQEGQPRREGPVCRACAHRSCASMREPGNGLASMASWLQGRSQDLARHQAAEEAHGEITDAVRQAQRVIDRPADRVFAGRCDCGTALYARPDAPQAKCQDCKDLYDVAGQREWMLNQVEDQLAHAAAAGSILRQIGVSIPDSTIRYYAQKGRILSEGTDANRRPLYRIGDILETLLQRKTA